MPPSVLWPIATDANALTLSPLRGGADIERFSAHTDSIASDPKQASDAFASHQLGDPLACASSLCGTPMISATSSIDFSW